jgi:porin
MNMRASTLESVPTRSKDGMVNGERMLIERAEAGDISAFGKVREREKRCTGRGFRERIRTICYLAALLLLSSGSKAFAQNSTGSADGGFGSKTGRYMFGDWGGERTHLASRGVTFDFFYVADLQANPVGGLEQTEAGWGRIRGTMDVDFGKLLEWNGLTFHVTGLWQFGGDLGADIGALANPSGLVSAHTTRLDSFWVQQAFLHNRLFVRVGQFAGLDFYGNQEYGASYVIEPLDYALGNLFSTTYESFDPAATPAAEIRVFPWRTLYIKSAVLAGNRNPYQQDPNGFHFQIKNTPVFVNEIGFTHDAQGLYRQTSHVDRKTYPGIYKFGSAYNDGKFTNAAGIESNGNYLIYGMANQALYRSEEGSNRGLDALFAFDCSPGDVNRENSQITAGVRYNGPIPSRPQDGAAFAFLYTKIGDPFQSFDIPLGLPPLGSEKAIELNYALQLRRYLLWQPIFQYYWDVGANSQIPNAAVFGFRVKVDF